MDFLIVKLHSKVIIITAISIAPYLNAMGEHIAFCKINKNVYTKTSII